MQETTNTFPSLVGNKNTVPLISSKRITCTGTPIKWFVTNSRFRAGIDDTLALSRVLVPVHQSPYPVCNFMRHTVLGALRLSQTVTYVQAVPHCAIFFHHVWSGCSHVVSDRNIISPYSKYSKSSSKSCPCPTLQPDAMQIARQLAHMLTLLEAFS